MNFPLFSCFLAIPLDDEAREVFRALERHIGDEYGRTLSFQDPDSPHLTLYYWDSVMEIEYGQIITQAEKIAEATEPFTLKLSGVNTFAGKHGDRVLYLDVPFSEPLARLKKKCPWPSLQPFHPHVTLTRIRHPQRFAVIKKAVLKALGNPLIETRVDRVCLYAEVGGRKQTLLQEFSFF